MTHPLRDRDFRLLFTARTLSLSGDAVVPAALALAVLRVTGSGSALAIVLAAAMLPRLVALPLGGVLADRRGARSMAIGTDTLACAAQLCTALLLLGGHPSLWQLAAAQAVGGAASGLALPTLSPLVVGTAPAASLGRANALLGTVAGATRLLGPAIAGTFVLTVGPGWTFLLDAGSFGASAVLISCARVKHRASEDGEPAKSLRADLRQGWREVRARDWYWTSLIAHAAWNGAQGAMLTLAPVIAVQRLGGETVWIVTTEAGAAGLVLGSLIAGRYRPRRPVAVANAGLAAYAIPLTALAFYAPAPVFVTCYGLALAGLGFLNPTWSSTVQAIIPAKSLARVSSYDWLLSLAAAPLGYTLGPWAASAWGPRAPLLVAAVLVAASCLGTLAAPGVRRLTLEPPKAAPTPEKQPV
ncbi:MFS transporter [Actinomadura logoneensis]|uniref:MFS transporter n=1 Tax=Actinomadura logoneensis TaxID=2293572 RepID=A0A372JNP4_9ACTN|nr:MFS transporter [Actinomadura logoneensis]RFU41590.1 MFS transporter [Actinomadura logoneensis]